MTVSAKVKEELWRRLKKYGVNVSEVIRRALEEEVRRREEEELGELLDEASRILRKLSEEEIVEAVRWSREAR